jgi:hypothetical protein
MERHRIDYLVAACEGSLPMCEEGTVSVIDQMGVVHIMNPMWNTTPQIHQREVIGTVPMESISLPHMIHHSQKVNEAGFLRASLDKEMELMRQQSDAWFQRETARSAASDGYKCMWQFTW